jgi:hypothetical protein
VKVRTMVIDPSLRDEMPYGVERQRRRGKGKKGI